MTEQKTYKCDRCGAIFYGDAVLQTPVFTAKICWQGSGTDDPEIKTFCDNCADNFYEFFFRAWKEFDKLAEKTLKSLPNK